MRRTITAPPTLAGAALDELKQWLAITTSGEDAALTATLRAALDAAEGFIGAMPLLAQVREIVPATPRWHRLATNPVHAVTQVRALPDGGGGGERPLPVEDYAIDLRADGTARLRLVRAGFGSLGLGDSERAGRLAVDITAGLAPDWATLPAGLRHGILRFAAHLHGSVDHAGETDGARMPPAAIAALWRPWRQVRLA